MAGAKTSTCDKRKRKAFKIEKKKSRPNIGLRNILNFRLTPMNPIKARWVTKKRLWRGRPYSGPKMDTGVFRVGRLEMSVMVVQQETSVSGAIPRIRRISPIESTSTRRQTIERRSNFFLIKGEVLVARSK